MSIVVKEILVKTTVEKTVVPTGELPEEWIRKLKQELLGELRKAERRRVTGKSGKER